jgi:hypothetical protein
MGSLGVCVGIGSRVLSGARDAHSHLPSVDAAGRGDEGFLWQPSTTFA